MPVRSYTHTKLGGCSGTNLHSKRTFVSLLRGLSQSEFVNVRQEECSRASGGNAASRTACRFKEYAPDYQEMLVRKWDSKCLSIADCCNQPAWLSEYNFHTFSPLGEVYKWLVRIIVDIAGIWKDEQAHPQPVDKLRNTCECYLMPHRRSSNPNSKNTADNQGCCHEPNTRPIWTQRFNRLLHVSREMGAANRELLEEGFPWT